jgi:hypothetical protein
MSKFPFPWLALGAGLLIALLLMLNIQAGPDQAALPLLTQLLLAEFGFVLNAIGVWVGWRDLRTKGRSPANLLVLAGCVVAALVLGLLGLSLWPEGGLTPPAQ